MPVTLEQARQNAADDLDLAAIDEFRTSNLIDDMIFDDVVNPVGGGGTLTYGYRRVKTLSTAGFRAINTEYAPTEATTEPHAVELKPLGGTYQIDRVITRVGPAATGENAFQMRQKIRATQAEFSDAVFNGDTGTDPDAFDGLSKALAGSSTELDGEALDWSARPTEDSAFDILEELDELLAALDGQPTWIASNGILIRRLKGAARRLGIYQETPGPIQNTEARFTYNGVTFMDPGNKAGTNEAIIPITGGRTDLYAVRVGIDGFHAVSMAGGPLVQTWAPDFTRAGAVKTGEVEMGPVAVVLKATKAAAVLRNVRIRPGA